MKVTLKFIVGTLLLLVIALLRAIGFVVTLSYLFLRGWYRKALRTFDDLAKEYDKAAKGKPCK